MKERRGNHPRDDSSEGARARCGSRARFRRHARHDFVATWYSKISVGTPTGRLSRRDRAGAGAVAGVELFELPRASADGTPLFRLRVEPLGDALQVEGVSALTPHHGAVVARELGVGRARVEGDATDAAHVVLIARVPRPDAHRLPLADVHYQASLALRRRRHRARHLRAPVCPTSRDSKTTRTGRRNSSSTSK